jgi:hypothetical protein
MLGTGETPSRLGEHLSSGRSDTRNLEVLTQKVGTPDLRQVKRKGSRAKASARDPLVVRLRAGRLRGPGAVGNLATPELLRRS